MSAGLPHRLHKTQSTFINEGVQIYAVWEANPGQKYGTHSHSPHCCSLRAMLWAHLNCVTWTVRRQSLTSNCPSVSVCLSNPGGSRLGHPGGNILRWKTNPDVQMLVVWPSTCEWKTFHFHLFLKQLETETWNSRWEIIIKWYRNTKFINRTT